MTELKVIQAPKESADSCRPEAPRRRYCMGLAPWTIPPIVGARLAGNLALPVAGEPAPEQHPTSDEPMHLTTPQEGPR